MAFKVRIHLLVLKKQSTKIIITLLKSILKTACHYFLYKKKYICRRNEHILERIKQQRVWY